MQGVDFFNGGVTRVTQFSFFVQLSYTVKSFSGLNEWESLPEFYLVSKINTQLHPALRHPTDSRQVSAMAVTHRVSQPLSIRNIVCYRLQME